MIKQPSTVTLLRDLPQEGRVSMERFATDLAEALEMRPEILPKEYVPGAVDTGGAIRVGTSDRITRYVRYPLAVRRLQSDIFHIIDHGYADLLLGLPAKRTVITCHDLMSLDAADSGASYGSTRLSTSRLRASLWLLRRAGHVVCDSVATRNSVLRLAGTAASRTTVVPLGVNRRFAPVSPERRAEVRAQFTSAHHMLFTVSNGGAARKNTPVTLRVLRNLRERGRDVALVHVGRPLSSAETALARTLGVEDAIVELGLASDAELVDAYSTADVVLFPSLHEGFGWPVLEAMACGTPVVMSDIPVLRETAGDAALSAAPTDVNGLTEAVCALLDDPARAKNYRERGLLRAASFNWNRTAEAYAEVYCSLLADIDGGNLSASWRTRVSWRGRAARR